MKLFDTLLLSLSVVLIIIGAYEVMALGLVQAYSFLMPAILIFPCFFCGTETKEK